MSWKWQFFTSWITFCRNRHVTQTHRKPVLNRNTKCQKLFIFRLRRKNMNHRVSSSLHEISINTDQLNERFFQSYAGRGCRETGKRRARPRFGFTRAPSRRRNGAERLIIIIRDGLQHNCRVAILFASFSRFSKLKLS